MTSLKDRMIEVRALVDDVLHHARDLGPWPADGTAEVTTDLLDRVSAVLADAVHDIETRRSMIDKTIAALRGKDVAVRPQELRAVSEASAHLRNGLTAMPDDVAGRESVVLAARAVYEFLAAIVLRDRSWT
jgi:hypothetical protein